MYSGNLRGAEWNKWDLHVHTPASVVQSYGDEGQNKTWEQYVSALEALPPEIKVVGINDYFFIEGYQRIRNAKESGRLPNLDLILPVIELRLAIFAGHTILRKINFHVIFSDEIGCSLIDRFFLKKLAINVKLDDGKPWHGDVSDRIGLAELGKAMKSATPKKKRNKESDVDAGFRSAAFSLDDIENILKETVFYGKYITAVGLSEWDQMRWDGAGAAQKKNVINSVDLVFTRSDSPEQYHQRRDQLLEEEVNARLLDCSDAHFYEDSHQPNRLGNVLTWLKADLTFEGLRRVANCFDDRVFVGDKPAKRKRFSQNKTKFIQSIEIRKKEDSKLDEVWFDCEVPFNSDLVAIIGDPGSGKSALTDIIALCGNSKVEGFSFLNGDKFCDTQNKAGEFEARLLWADGGVSRSSLDDTIDEAAVERVRYVPQGFFETVTNETSISEGGLFYGEIKKVIFSHIREDDRLGCISLDELLDHRTREMNRTIQLLRQELVEINRDIVELEQATSPKKVELLKNNLALKESEIDAHRANKPEEVEEPTADENADAQLRSLRKKEKALRKNIKNAKTKLAKAKRQRDALDLTSNSLENTERELGHKLDEIQGELDDENIELAITDVITVEIDLNPLSEVQEKVQLDIDEFDLQLDADESGSLLVQLQDIKDEINQFVQEIDGDSQKYQEYCSLLSEWETDLVKLEGDRDTPETLHWYEGQLRVVVEIMPDDLATRKQDRREKTREIHAKIVELAEMYEDLTRPVQNHIRNNQLIREKYRLEFDIGLVQKDIGNLLFNLVAHQSGTFAGIEPGRRRLNDIVAKHDFSSPDDTLAFAEEVLDNLQNNYKNAPPTPVEVHKVLKKGISIKDVYDLLFGLQYVTPQYNLALNVKPLKRLTPGERGILLLVFYLVVDLGDVPLIIDQPEGNLNNQMIFDNLVSVFKAAKERRQVLIVTHNPNLAVVCDAEQVIHATIDSEDRYRVNYDSGALENPKFNKLSLDLLEGTPPAFNARKSTYESL